jgi:hypothetical protein
MKCMLLTGYSRPARGVKSCRHVVEDSGLASFKKCHVVGCIYTETSGGS